MHTIMISESGAYRVRFDRLDSSEFLRRSREGLSFGTADRIVISRPAVAARFAFRSESGDMTGFLGSPDTLSLNVPGAVVLSGTGAEHPVVSPRYGVEPDGHLPISFPFDPRIAWPDDRVRIVIGVMGCNSQCPDTGRTQFAFFDVGRRRLLLPPTSNLFRDGSMCTPAPRREVYDGVDECFRKTVMTFEASSFGRDLTYDEFLDQATHVFRYEPMDDGTVKQLPADIEIGELNSFAPSAEDASLWEVLMDRLCADDARATGEGDLL